MPYPWDEYRSVESRPSIECGLGAIRRTDAVDLADSRREGLRPPGLRPPFDRGQLRLHGRRHRGGQGDAIPSTTRPRGAPTGLDRVLHGDPCRPETVRLVRTLAESLGFRTTIDRIEGRRSSSERPPLEPTSRLGRLTGASARRVRPRSVRGSPPPAFPSLRAVFPDATFGNDGFLNALDSVRHDHPAIAQFVERLQERNIALSASWRELYLRLMDETEVGGGATSRASSASRSPISSPRSATPTTTWPDPGGNCRRRGESPRPLAPCPLRLPGEPSWRWNLPQPAGKASGGGG